MNPINNGVYVCPACSKDVKGHSSEELKKCYLRIPSVMKKLLITKQLVCDTSGWGDMHLAKYLDDTGSLSCEDHFSLDRWIVTSKEEGFSLWTVYDHPSDFPDSFVTRRSEFVKGVPITTCEIFHDESFEAIEEFLAEKGLFAMMRQEGDDPCIIATWM